MICFMHGCGCFFYAYVGSGKRMNSMRGNSDPSPLSFSGSFLDCIRSQQRNVVAVFRSAGAGVFNDFWARFRYSTAADFPDASEKAATSLSTTFMMSLDGEGVMEVPVPVTAMAETGKIPEGFSVGMPYSICT